MTKPLGLPVGSVRALLLLALTARAILALRCGQELDPWLWVAVLVSAAAYFSARSTTLGWGPTPPPAYEERPPLSRLPLALPRGTIRTLFLVGIGYGLWLWTRNHHIQLRTQPLVLVLGAFVAGVMVRWFLGQVRRPEDTSALMLEHVLAFATVAGAAGLVWIGTKCGSLPEEWWVEPTLAAGCTFYAGSR